ncbi:MAG: carboxypeptidase-like regulatory domain-containing protein, partial [Chitinophagaceae bacterium]
MKSSRKYFFSKADTVFTNLRQAKLFLLFTVFFVSVLGSLNAQTPVKLSVTGTVQDSIGNGLQGVTVSEKGTRNATTTATDGSFSIKVANNRSVLVFSSVGYEGSQQVVGTNTVMTVSLKSSNADLGEVVVIGFGTRKKESLTGAIS